MLNNALLFLFETVLDLLTLAFLLRFYFQLTRVSFQNQVAQMIVSLTNFAVKPTRRILSALKNLGFNRIDISTLLLAYITQLILLALTLLLSGLPFLASSSHTWLLMLGITLINILIMSLSIFLYAILIQAILSWINPHTPIAPILDNLSNPVLRFLRKFIPPAGNIDLNPLIFIITAQLLLTTILIPLKKNLLSLL